MADDKALKHTVTNVSDGPRVLNSTPPVLLQAGASTDGAVEISEGELAVIKGHDWFDLGTKKAPGKPAE